MSTKGKAHIKGAVGFDGIIQIPFDNLASVTASIGVNAVSVPPVPMAQHFKIEHVSATATAISGSPAFQIVVGTGNAGSPGSTDTNAIAGTTVFAAPVSISAAAGTCQVNYPANYDVIYPASRPYAVPAEVAYPLSLRVVTGPGDTATNLKVTVAGKCIDPTPGATETPTLLGNYGYDPSTH